ncbi:MAG: ATP phosphoribosyltransferase regulatory subunit [Faecalibacterium sp.]|nr:ATP phosphoribosyltransferase regulatory subunit [Ruminococcus sp.]MCM1391272.1 ATP phosphoribosyltransferase regulatory subunit [Ruminococcus sp.]MCM1484754.1 ATP phosphoribosyltransferase regulatory subunit [Faecalibacterium sp.]
MDNFSSILKSEEKAVFALRSLYRKYGYLPYKMSKFEEYDLYVRNKDFLVSDSVITFNDTNGKLLALKPDVTLSIVKNSLDEPGCKQKLFYNENVYRISGSTHMYKEIMQTGLECIGDIDIYDITEVLLLALESLDAVGDEFVLDISHMGIITALLDEVSDDEEFKRKVTHCIGEKNRHGIKEICKEYEAADDAAEMLADFVGIYGAPESVIEKLKATVAGEKASAAVAELESIWNVLSKTVYKDKINFDFSIVNDMNYYNGIVFTGFLDGIPESVLSGGQYDNLVRKMGKKSGAIGFAVYLDLLEYLHNDTEEYDVDVLLLYDETTDVSMLFSKVKELTAGGKSVSAQKEMPKKLRCKQVITLKEKED